MMKSSSIIRVLVIINTLWLLLYSSSCSPNYFLVLFGDGVVQPSRTLDAHSAAEQSTLRGSSKSEGKRRKKKSKALKFLHKFPGLPVCEVLNDSSDVDVTLVTQTSLDRLHLMKDICSRWEGPVSLVVANVHLSQLELVDQLTALGCHENSVTASVYNQDFPLGRYPVNVLRNMALRQAKTSHAINLDIDLVPSKNLYTDILYHRELMRVHNSTAIVVPAFQLNPTPECHSSEALLSEDCSDILHDVLPETKDELLKHYAHPFQEPEARIFQFTGRDHYYGHSSTGYGAWAKQNPAHSLEPLECLQSVRYEPYLVVRLCEDLPPYQEQFTGYGKNKVSWMWHVERRGYRFLRLGSGFTIHYPHPRSTAKRAWRDRKKELGRENIDVEKTAVAFRSWLEQEVPDETTLPFCEDYQSSYS